MFSSIKSKLFRDNLSEQSYELVERNPEGPSNELDSEESQPSNRSRSRSSLMLEDINQYAQNHGKQDDFTTREIQFTEEDRDFIRRTFLGFKVTHFNRRFVLLVFGAVCLLWTASLIAYGHSNILHKQSSIMASNTNNTNSSSWRPSDAVSSKKKIAMDTYRMGYFYPFYKTTAFVDDRSSDDTGAYVERRGKGYVMKRLSDPLYDETLIDSNSFEYQGVKYTFKTFVPLGNSSKSLVSSDIETQWRHSSFAHYWLYDGSTARFSPLTPVAKEVVKLNFVEVSPHGDKLLLSYENNLYIQDVGADGATQITIDGSTNIFNGKPDWVYEEEVLASDRAVWWSDDGTTLAFLRINETSVPVYEVDFYVNGEQYPDSEQIKYPKAGSPNPTLKIMYYRDGKVQEISRDDSKLGEEFIVYDCIWIDNDDFLIKETDRESNVLNVRMFKPSSGESKIAREVNAPAEYGGWHEKTNDIVVIPPHDDIVAAGYVDLVVRDGFLHLGYFQNVLDAEPIQLTSGSWNVRSGTYGYDKDTHELYFTSTKRSSMGSHLLSVNIKTKEIRELTDLSKDAKYDVQFSPGSKYANLVNEGPSIPEQKFVELARLREDAYLANCKVMNDNAVIKLSMEDYEYPTKMYREITVGKYDDGSDLKLNVIEIRPYNFDATKKHPLLVLAYGGPGSQTVQMQFSVGFEEMICSSLDAVVLIVDPRGTAGKGWRFKSYSNNNIGYWEPRDITKLVADYIQQNAFIDAERTAIWGWSYGGFTTLKTLEYDHGSVIKYGMAVAPVTNWLYYDSIYTERYMNLPENNPNYAEAAVNHAERFKDVKRFLIMHGTADDNVHLQNTLNLLDKFDLKSVENYDVHVFPDSDHSIYFHNANSIVYDKLFSWLKNAFDGNFDNIV